MSQQQGNKVLGHKEGLFFSGFSVAGLLVSLYTIRHHLQLKMYGETDAVCNINSSVSCDQVAASAYSEFLGLPLGVWGAAFFATLIALLFMYKKSAAQWQLSMIKALVFVAVPIVLVLAWISITIIKTICIACLGVYVSTLLLFLFCLKTLKLVPFWPSALSPRQWSSVLAPGAVVLILFVMYQNVIRHSPDEGAGVSDGKQTPIPLNPVKVDIPINKNKYSGLGEDYRKGSDEAKVTVVEFSDFECPACKGMYGPLKKIYQEYGDRILMVYKNFPLDNACNPFIGGPMHRYACAAAAMARCAGQYDKFWQFHDIAFENQENLGVESIRAWASAIGLTQEQMDACKSDQSIVAKIKDDLQVGKNIGVNSTPSVYVNGVKYAGGGLPALRAMIEKELSNNM